MNERGNRLLRKLDRYCGIPALYGLSCIKKIAGLRKKSFILKPDARIVIYCPAAIGDLLLASALIDGIRKYSPGACLDIIASPANSQVIPLLPMDNAIVYPVTRPDLVIRHCRRQKYDVFFDTSQWSRLGAIIAACSGSRHTVGFRTRGQYRHWGYDTAVAHNDATHETDNFLALGAAIWPGFSGASRLKLPNAELSASRYICCHMHPAPGRFSFLKEWPEEYWAVLIKRLKKDFLIYLTGNKANLERNRNFLHRYFPDDEKVIIPEPMQLQKLASLFLNARAVISVNTGVMHLAALCGVPTIGLHGPTNPMRWGPRGERCIALLPDSGQRAYLNLGFEYPAQVRGCMEFLPVSQVLRALKQLAPEDFKNLNKRD